LPGVTFTALGFCGVERREKLFGGGGGGADLADDDAGGVVGEHRRLDQRRAGGERGGERRNHRVARARHVVDLTRRGRDVNRAAVLFEQHHAALAARDEDGAAAEPRAYREGGPRDALVRVVLRVRHALRLVVVRRDERCGSV